MNIEFFNEETNFPDFNKKEAEKWLVASIKNENKNQGDLNIIFCSDEYLLKINKEYLDHHYYTDIVTFDYSEEGIISGDLFISTERIKSNSEYFKVNFLQELHRVMIHGILHLCGYKDATKEDKKLMSEKEDYYLNLAGIT